jgi:CubicO group peptidase (beta-lactamase class C family)
LPRPFSSLAAVVLLASGLGAATLRSGPPAAAPAEGLGQVDAILEEQQKKEHIPGLAFVAVRDDRVVILRTLGERDRERKLPVTSDTLFPIGSCTKAFTAMAVALSRDAGLLSLDDSPHRFLPWFKMADPEADATVTLRDMLSHQTGLKAYADLAAEPGVLTREQYLRATISARPVARPRTRFQYSNAMYSAAGEILARVHGAPWESVIERTLFRPIGMSSSLASLEAVPAAPDHAVSYVYEAAAGDWKAVPAPASLNALGPAGSIASTANDMARWLRFLAAGGVIDGRRVVSEASVREVARPQIAINDAWSYGLGWAIYRWNGHTVVEHNGGSAGISAVMSFIPDRHAGFAFLANTSPNYMTRISSAGKLLWPILLDEKAAPETAPSPSPAKPSPTPGPSPPAGPPSVDKLIARMIAAQGGEKNVLRHRSMEVRGTKAYANQGIDADLVVLAEAPDRRTEEETWTAAGTRIGSVRVFYDGTRGGQETTFGQDETYGDEENDRARREAILHPLLDLTRAYKDVRLQRTGLIGGEETYVLDLTPARGAAVVWHVSKRTGRLLQTESEGKVATFTDYREVDGELVPFRTTSQEDLGEIVVDVKQVRFNVDLPAGAFGPSRPAGSR